MTAALISLCLVLFLAASSVFQSFVSGPPSVPLPLGVMTVHLDDVTHQISSLTMGCHSDTGFSHQARGFFSQMIVGSSFNATHYHDGRWNIARSTGVAFTAETDPSDTFFGTPSEKLSFASGTGEGWVSNRGLGNAGMVFESGKEYEGFVFARGSSADATIYISIENYESKVSLGSQTITVGNSSSYSRHNFSFVASSGTGCLDIEPATEPEISCGHGRPSSPVGHTCVKCSGEFKIAMSGPGSVWINYVFLQPGQWGRVPGLSVLKSAADNLASMGIKAIRQGGSYASVGRRNAAYYQWQKWTGPQWQRPSRTNGVWKSCLLAGWGPFEMIDMCNALDIEPIITTTDSSTAESLADLVEYCWGDSSTRMGAKRAADGHPDQYRVKYFELGNEQYNTNYIEQVVAMEKRATELGMAGEIFYLFPDNHFLNKTDIARAASLSPRIDGQLVADIHIHGESAVGAARNLFASNASFQMGAANAETNKNTHTFSRAMSEAADLNEWFNAADVASRLHFRAASFCMGESNDFDAWDQGISFFLPNMTWLQPPGYVHSMVNHTWMPQALRVTSSAASLNVKQFSAQKSTDGNRAVLRFVNDNDTTQAVTVTLTSSAAEGGAQHPRQRLSATVWTLSSADPGTANTPGDPKHVSPAFYTTVFTSEEPVLVPPNTYMVMVISLTHKNKGKPTIREITKKSLD